VFQESEEEVTDTEQAENWFSQTSARRVCGGYLTLASRMSMLFIYFFNQIIANLFTFYTIATITLI